MTWPARRLAELVGRENIYYLCFVIKKNALREHALNFTFSTTLVVEVAKFLQEKHEVVLHVGRTKTVPGMP